MKIVKNFKSFLLERSMVPLGSTLGASTYVNLKMGDAPAKDLINKALLDDIEKAAKAAGVRALVTSANSDHPMHREYSRHSHGLAVDIARIGDQSVPFEKLEGSNGATKGNPNTNPRFKEAGNRLADALVSIGYKIITHDPDLKAKHAGSLATNEGQGDRVVIWQMDSPKAGNHYNHLHISNQASSASTEVATVQPGKVSAQGSNLPSKIRTSSSVAGPSINTTGAYDDEYTEPKKDIGTSLVAGALKTSNLQRKGADSDVATSALKRAIQYIS